LAGEGIEQLLWRIKEGLAIGEDSET
jgi:hypothetical protein